MNTYIPVLPGEVKTPDDKYTNILELLGITGLTPIAVENDGRHDPIVAALRIGGNQYALADVLKKLGDATVGNTLVRITKPEDDYVTSKTFAEMAAADNLAVTWNGKAAVDVAYTTTDDAITAIAVKFLTFGDGTMTVSTFTINASGVTKADAEYTLTAQQAEEDT